MKILTKKELRRLSEVKLLELQFKVEKECDNSMAWKTKTEQNKHLKLVNYYHKINDILIAKVFDFGPNIKITA